MLTTISYIITTIIIVAKFPSEAPALRPAQDELAPPYTTPGLRYKITVFSDPAPGKS